jgi:hypothetical protein
LPNSGDEVAHEQEDAEEAVEDDEMLREQGSTAPMYSSPYSSFLLPLLLPGSLQPRSDSGNGVFTYDDFYRLIPGFEVPSVAAQISALEKEKNFKYANAELRFMAKYMFRTDATAPDDTCREFLLFLGDTPGVPCNDYLGFGIVLYCDALKNAGEQPRLYAVSEVTYSTPTSEAPCERIIGIVRRMIGDSKYNLALKTLTGMLVLKNEFDEKKLVLRK